MDDRESHEVSELGGIPIKRSFLIVCQKYGRKNGLFLGMAPAALAQCHCGVRKFLYVQPASFEKVYKTFVLHVRMRCNNEILFNSVRFQNFMLFDLYSAEILAGM